MKKVELKKEVSEKDFVVIFGDKIESKKYELKEVIQIVRDKFENDLVVGNMAYYFLMFKNLKLVEVSYEVLSSIIVKIFELNGLQCNTTGKCMAWYNGRIKKGLIDVNVDFKSNVRNKKIIDINSLF